jgi:hypothetical protein
MNEFSLMLRMGSNKEILEAFTDQVFQKFPSFSQIPLSQQAQVPPPKEESSKKDHKKPQATVVEIEDDDDEGEEVELSFGERLFLALFA